MVLWRPCASFAARRSGATRVLITTDVWARGLDVQQVCPAALWSIDLSLTKP